jgi:hypothetical protein
VNYDRKSDSDGASRVREEPDNGKHSFDLEERTALFGEAIVRFSKRTPRDPTNNTTDQLLGCGTSIGANYYEADERVSKKDFRNAIGRCAKRRKRRNIFFG